MFPIRDHNPSERTPYVTYALIAANLLVFAATYPYGGDQYALSEVFQAYGLIPVRLSYGEGYSTLVTSMFLHAGIMHIAGNMLFLWIFGDNLEDKLGHVGFLAFYLASGVGAALMQILPAPSSQVPMVGASGAIAGVMGGYLLLFPRARVDVIVILVIFFKIFPMPAWLMLGLWFGLQVFNGLASPLADGGVAYWAHAGGFLVGLAWVLPIWLRAGGPAYWARTDGQPEHPDAKYKLVRSSIPRVRRPK